MTRTFAARLLAIAFLVLSLVGLTACDNTIRGVGEDVRDTGDAVEDQFE